MWFAAGQSDPVSGALLQYGAVGVIALLGILVSRVLFNRLNQALDRESARADRLEEQLRTLNETVRTEYVTTLSAASHAIQEANRAVADALSAVRRS
jgi:hypothetical protein